MSVDILRLSKLSRAPENLIQNPFYHVCTQIIRAIQHAANTKGLAHGKIFACHLLSFLLSSPPTHKFCFLSLSLYLKIPTTLQLMYIFRSTCLYLSLSFFFSPQFTSSKFAFQCLHPRHEDETRRDETR